MRFSGEAHSTSETVSPEPAFPPWDLDSIKITPSFHELDLWEKNFLLISVGKMWCWKCSQLSCCLREAVLHPWLSCYAPPPPHRGKSIFSRELLWCFVWPINPARCYLGTCKSLLSVPLSLKLSHCEGKPEDDRNRILCTHPVLAPWRGVWHGE